MGNIAPSSPAVSENPSKGLKFSGGRGRSSSKSISTPGLAPSLVSLPSETLIKLQEADMTHNTIDEDDDDDLTFSDDSESEEEEAEDEEWEERLRILEDARNMKKMAELFLHPEKPVESEGSARCFFDRASAPECLTLEECDEISSIMEEAKNLKKVAVDYLHPELPVVSSDPNACGRNYFSRPSSHSETKEDDDERSAVFEDLKMLEALAVDFLHPERPVCSSVAVTRGHVFPESSQESEERFLIMQDLAALKRAAADYLHPERPISVTDATACARCFFGRSSAPQEDASVTEARLDVMKDAAALKALAADYMHPERSVKADAIASARCYFDRASASVESLDDIEARESVIADCLELKSLAADYMHPELPVTGSGYGARCYFDRSSAVQQESVDDSEERLIALRDAALFKKLATDYMHPEIPVRTEDPTAFARSYFGRPSAPAQDMPEDGMYRALVLDDAKRLRKTAVDYMHPEMPVEASNAGSRCFFDRASAVEQSSAEDAEERARLLADARALKASALQFLHPELPIESTTTSARCFFDRFSAPVTEPADVAESRTQVLADAAALKKLATDYFHPELPVVSTETGARCYFDRHSALATESAEEAEEVALALADAAALKKHAIQYTHPELPVRGSDPATTGRCYFDRPSSRLHDQMIHSFPPHEDDDHSDHHEHGDHFGLDEDFGFFNEVCDKLTGADISQTKVMGEDEESNLSRSPSSVMLFQEESIYD